MRPTPPRRSGGPPSSRPRLTRPALVAAGVAALAVGALAVLAVLIWQGPASTPSPAPISVVDTQDVHSLAFVGTSERVLLGHHGGILESRDGGTTWRAWGQGADAMAMGVAGDEPVIVAGHDVLAQGSPDGRWVNIADDLPHIDIHGFARDPNDPAHLWAYLATGGLFESRDGGAHWAEVFAGHAVGVTAVERGTATRLLAVDPQRGAIVASDDGGRGWQEIGAPPSTPVYALAAANQGATVVYAGSGGLFRSDDGGSTFRSLLDVGEPILAVATTADATSIVVATRERAIYRSDDGGRSWPSR